VVQRGSAFTVPEPVNMAEAQPAIFTADKTGTGQGLVYAVSENGTTALAAGSQPAPAGGEILISCSGLGAVDPPLPDGTAASDTRPPVVVNPVTVTIGGREAKLLSARLAPGQVGLYEVRAIAPADAAAGDAVPVTLTVAGQTSPPVTMAIR
jgi:uncharacterized protein (TIGR03437 family)